MDYNIISKLVSLATQLDEIGETERANEVDLLTKELVKPEAKTTDMTDEQIIKLIEHGFASLPKDLVVDRIHVYMTDNEFQELDETEKQAILKETNELKAHIKIKPIMGQSYGNKFFVEVPFHLEPDSPEALLLATNGQFGYGGSIIKLLPDKQGNHLRYLIYCNSID